MNEPVQRDEKEPMSGRKALIFAVLIIVIAGVVAIAGILPRVHAQKSLSQHTDELALANVVVEKPQMGEPSQELVLPGNMFAYVDSPIYARTNGYLQKWYFDIGARVRKGQLLAVIASPEVDQELAQAKQDLATAEASAGYANKQAQRYTGLLKNNAVTAQDTQNFVSQAASTSAAVKSAQANVQRVEAMVGFEKIYAPFTGTITARDVDTGTLINAGAGAAGAEEMFHLDDEHVMRVYVNVPQVDSPMCGPGTAADLTLEQYPGRSFRGKVVRTARAIDPASRTLLVEVDVPNPDGVLVPGDYTQVHFNLHVAHSALIIPAAALLFRQQGLEVATVVNGNIAKLVHITIGQDDGRVVQVTQGLNADDEVIQSPPDSIIDGEKLRVVSPNSEGGIPGAPVEPNRGQAGPEGGQ
ncbi:MAG TPA: efflux RND transporter periplasmic adaptor subunit [Acidobacteriaceae bacterium]|jgi:RND family efflux transporter MFP subunit|nr:efflux RND transporter periplasmic adaptor subunit [Acidobacteriaceae bacterium]